MYVLPLALASLFSPSVTTLLNGVRIEHASWNSVSSDAVLLLMGHSATMTWWRHGAERLQRAGLRVIALDNRDSGLSQRFDSALPDPVPATLPAITCEHSQPGPTPDGGGVCAYTLDDLADDAVGVLDHYGVERAHVLGASMGGVVAQIIASRHAARCRSLSLVMTAERIGEATAATAAASDGAFIGALGAATLPPPHPGMTKDEYWELIQTDEAHPERCAELAAEAVEIDTADFDRGGVDWHGLGGARQTLAIIEWERRRAAEHASALRGLKMPALVLHGKHDPLVGIDAGRGLAAATGARFVEYAGGHNFGHSAAERSKVWDEIVEHIKASP